MGTYRREADEMTRYTEDPTPLPAHEAKRARRVSLAAELAFYALLGGAAIVLALLIVALVSLVF